MRITYLIFSILVSVSVVSARTLTFKDVMAESAALRKSIALAKTVELKKEELKKWETTLQATLKSYEDENPKEGNAEEDLVGKYFISMEPVFDLTKESCRKATHQIELEDRDNTKKDPSKLSDEAKESLAVLNLFCN